MASAPDPKELAAKLAIEAAVAAAEEQRKVREETEVWLFLSGERRVLRAADMTARHVQALRRVGVNVVQVWSDIMTGDLEVFVAAWWLAGMQAGVVEEYDKLLDLDFRAAPYVHFPSDEERETDGGGVLDPPA